MNEPSFLHFASGNAALTPAQIVSELDEYVVGQAAAKRAVAIALRNRWRRQQVEPPLRQEILPNNIILIGPTGVGKTEIARRLARLARAPFVKVEATKFTEVGYVGRDVESMVRDLVEIAIGEVRAEWGAQVEAQARVRTEERLVELLLPGAEPAPPDADPEGRHRRSRDKLRDLLRAGELEERRVPVDVPVGGMPLFDLLGGGDQMGVQVAESLGSLFPGRRKRQEMAVREARAVLHAEEVEKLIDMEKARAEALRRVETAGIIFLDEIDKVAAPRGEHAAGPDVSRQGVQRDLLPIVEGTSVATKYGVVRTEHVLFIAAGAFHMAKPSDLIPELQGRFPIRVELQSLSEDDFVRILTEPRNALVRQYAALLGAEGCVLEFTPEAVREVARVAAQVNARAENIGARRLHTVMTTLLDGVLFELPDSGRRRVEVDAAYVAAQLGPILRDEDLGRYIL